ncbi:hypothetical protein GQ457_09G013360 [Hibiscus cannabinus]
MGKNQTYKAMQRARLGSSSAGPEEIEDGMVDGSFHSPEWHAARLASLKTSHTVTWEEFKKKQKVSNKFYFTFSIRPEAMKEGLMIRNVVPATEEEARRVLERMDAERCQEAYL